MPLAAALNVSKHFGESPLCGFDVDALARENRQLREMLATRDAELREARTRTVDAIDEERRRIERNLHDGAQQQLVAIALKLTIIRRRLECDSAPAGADLDEAISDLMKTTEELRSLATGVVPPCLASNGLAAAIEDLAARSPLPVKILGVPFRRLNERVETTVYFIVAEALTNVVKHAHASAIALKVSEGGGVVTLEVCDDGVGGADTRGGTGLRGLQDRVATFQGHLEVSDVAGGGTLLRATLNTDSTSR